MRTWEEMSDEERQTITELGAKMGIDDEEVLALVRRLEAVHAAQEERNPATGNHPAFLEDGWTDSEGCWADRWDEEHGEYLSCDEAPNPASPQGLCDEHQAMWDRRKARTDELIPKDPRGGDTINPSEVHRHYWLRTDAADPALNGVWEWADGAWQRPDLTAPDTALRILVSQDGTRARA